MKRLVLAGLIFGSTVAQAAAVTVTDVGKWLENRSTNTIGRTPGLQQLIDVTSVVPNGLNGTTATATQGAVTIPLPYVGSTTIPNEFSTSFAADPALYGAWQLNFLNGSDTSTATTPAIDPALVPMPFANNVRVINATSTSFNWSIPAAASVDAVRVNIFDHGRLNLAGTNVDLVYNRTFVPTTTSFTVPSLLTNNLPLINGNLYTLEISLIDFASNSVSGSQNDLRNRSRLFVDFTPGLTPSAGAYLPVVVAGVGSAPPVFHFNITGVGSNMIYIDPALAVGYAYATGAGNPNFASVLLPTGIGDKDYQVVLADGTRVAVKGGAEYTFASGGRQQLQGAGHRAFGRPRHLRSDRLRHRRDLRWRGQLHRHDAGDSSARAVGGRDVGGRPRWIGPAAAPPSLRNSRRLGSALRACRFRFPSFVDGIRRALSRGATTGPPYRSDDMSYIDGFVIAVPTANKQKFIEHARTLDPMFIELGAIRVIEGWGNDVPDGKVTDFRRAVQATPEETVAFSWIEWPDKATRDAGMKKVMEDPRMDPSAPGNPPMPFDGKRMIFGGFDQVVEVKA